MLPDFPRQRLIHILTVRILLCLAFGKGVFYFDGTGGFGRNMSFNGKYDRRTVERWQVFMYRWMPGIMAILTEVADAEQLTDDGTMDSLKRKVKDVHLCNNAKRCWFQYKRLLTSETIPLA